MTDIDLCLMRHKIRKYPPNPPRAFMKALDDELRRRDVKGARGLPR